MSDRCEPPRVGTYYAKDGWVRKRSEQTRNPDGSTTYTLDFRVCRMADEVGDEAAETVAALMNRGESATPAEVETLRAERDSMQATCRKLLAQLQERDAALGAVRAAAVEVE